MWKIFKNKETFTKQFRFFVLFLSQGLEIESFTGNMDRKLEPFI